MLPLKDDVPSRQFPVLTLTLIGLNVLAFLYQLRVGPRMDELLLYFSVLKVRKFYSRSHDDERQLW